MRVFSFSFCSNCPTMSWKVCWSLLYFPSRGTKYLVLISTLSCFWSSSKMLPIILRVGLISSYFAKLSRFAQRIRLPIPRLLGFMQYHNCSHSLGLYFSLFLLTSSQRLHGAPILLRQSPKLIQSCLLSSLALERHLQSWRTSS